MLSVTIKYLNQNTNLSFKYLDQIQFTGIAWNQFEAFPNNIWQYTRYHLSEHYILQFIQTLISQSDDKVFAQLIVWRNGYIRENYGTFLGQIVTYELGSFVGPGNLPYLRGGRGEKINFG